MDSDNEDFPPIVLKKKSIGLVRLPLLESTTSPPPQSQQPSSSSSEASEASPTPSKGSANTEPTMPQVNNPQNPTFQPMVFLTNDSSSSASTPTWPKTTFSVTSQSLATSDDEISFSSSSEGDQAETDEERLMRRLETKRKRIDAEIERFREQKLIELAEYEKKLREKLERKQRRRNTSRTIVDNDGDGNAKVTPSAPAPAPPPTVKSLQPQPPEKNLATEILQSITPPVATYRSTEKESHLGIFTPGYLPLLDHSFRKKTSTGEEEEDDNEGGSDSNTVPFRPRSLSVSTSQSAPVVPTQDHHVRRHSASDQFGRPLHPSLRHTSSYGPNATRLKSPKRVTFKFDDVMFVPSRSSPPPERPRIPETEDVSDEEMLDGAKNSGTESEDLDSTNGVNATGVEGVTSSEKNDEDNDDDTPSPSHVDGSPTLDKVTPATTTSTTTAAESQDDHASVSTPTATSAPPALIPSLHNGTNHHHKKVPGAAVRFAETVEVKEATDEPGMSTSAPLESPLFVLSNTYANNSAPENPFAPIPDSVLAEMPAFETPSTGDDEFLFEFDEAIPQLPISPSSSPPSTISQSISINSFNDDVPTIQTYSESLRHPTPSLRIPISTIHPQSLPTHFTPHSFPRKPPTKYLSTSPPSPSTSPDSDIHLSSLPAFEKGRLLRLRTRPPPTSSSLSRSSLPPLPVPPPHTTPQLLTNSRFPSIPIPRASPGQKLLNPFMASAASGARGTPYESELAAEVARLAEEEGDVVGSVVGGLEEDEGGKSGMSFSVRLRMEEMRGSGGDLREEIRRVEEERGRRRRTESARVEREREMERERERERERDEEEEEEAGAVKESEVVNGGGEMVGGLEDVD